MHSLLSYTITTTTIVTTIIISPLQQSPFFEHHHQHHASANRQKQIKSFCVLYKTASVLIITRKQYDIYIHI